METTTDFLLCTLDNDRTAYEKCVAIVRRNMEQEHPNEAEGIWSHAEAVKFQSADDIKDWVEYAIDDAGAPGPETKGLIVVTLVRRAFEDIDWHKIAEHYIGKVAEGATV